MAKYLVTGGAGFIGSHVVDALVKQNQSVVVLDNLLTGKKENISHNLNSITFIEGSITDETTIKNALEGVDYVIHLAALPSVPRSIKRPLEANHHNITGSLQLFEQARKTSVKRIVSASSSSLYGNSKEFPKVETIPRQPLSFYALQKATMEAYGELYHSIYGSDIVLVRFFNVFGPRQDPDSEYSAVIPKFIKLMKAGTAPSIYGDGETSRDFTYIANVVDGLLKACVVEADIGGEIINLACGDRITLNQLVNDINILLKTNLEPRYVDFRIGDIKHSNADITKARTLFGFSPSITFTQGLKLTADSLDLE
jgi:UDP-glucose 4-epimerase